MLEVGDLNLQDPLFDLALVLNDLERPAVRIGARIMTVESVQPPIDSSVIHVALPRLNLAACEPSVEYRAFLLWRRAGEPFHLCI